MKNSIKQKHIGITLTLIGIVLLSFNFLSYLMSSTFVSGTILPIGIVSLISGVFLINRSKKTRKI